MTMASEIKNRMASTPAMKMGNQTTLPMGQKAQPAKPAAVNFMHLYAVWSDRSFFKDNITPARNLAPYTQ